MTRAEINRRLAKNPKWRKAVTAANRRLAADPKWRAARKAAAQRVARNTRWRKANKAARLKMYGSRRWRRAQARRSLTNGALPIKRILALYALGTTVVAIALAIGNPYGGGNNRVVDVLIKAGVYRGHRANREYRGKHNAARRS